MSLIENLQNPSLYPHPVASFEVIETHISWVLLTGEYVYKIKKPVNFGFLDFSSLEKRRYYCEEEIRLNRRLAPQLYLDVIAIHGSEQHPVLNGQGPIIEYAVRMRQFPQSAQLDRILTDKGLERTVMDKLSYQVAQFHLSIRTVKHSEPFGELAQIKHPVQENFTQIRDNLNDPEVKSLLEQLEAWSETQLEQLTTQFLRRKQQGYIRECHGDMHLRNIALWNNEILIFDCIEFNENLYWIDVISDIAFLIMDLEDRHQTGLAWRFLNMYLEITGDYEGLQLLNFYKVYRAMVRAKVDALRFNQEQPGSTAQRYTLQDCLQYLKLAKDFTHTVAPCLLINHGLSGSGKSRTTRQILEKYSFIQLRSDAERKRLFQPSDQEHSKTVFGKGIYTQEATKQTYKRLVDLARMLLKAGYSVVIDAANLKYEQRHLFVELAKDMGVGCLILDYAASKETLRARVKQREKEGTDISDATVSVLEQQLLYDEPISTEEAPFSIKINTDDEIELDSIIERIHAACSHEPVTAE